MSRDWTMLTWREQTWGERAKHVLAWLLATIFTICFAVGTLLILGQAMDGVDRYHVEHDRCLKHATNGYDIKRCN
jgi:hypothetical protein